VALDPQQLPDDPAELKKLVAGLIAERDQARADQARVRELIEELLRDKRSRKSEKPSGAQLALFAAEWPWHGPAEAPATPAEAANGPDTPGAGGRQRRRSTGRPALPAHLPRQRCVHDLSEADKTSPCPGCGETLRPLNAPDTSERFQYVPAQLLVIEDVCLKNACACRIRTAGKPAQPLPKSIADAGLLAFVLTWKYLHHLPLHRQEQIWSAQGVRISRKTAGGWVGQMAVLLGPLYQTLKAHVFGSKVLGHDDTGVKVLDPALNFARTGRLWPHLGDREHPGVLFHYTPTRGGEAMRDFLADYHGQYLQVDAYAAYDGLFEDAERKLKRVGCWAHARRYVEKALETAGRWMQLPMLLIHELYQIEKRAAGWAAEARLALRQSHALPLLANLRQGLLSLRASGHALPKSPAGKAVNYILRQWDTLVRYCEDGDLEIDNNRTERSLRGVAVGRRNWTFFGSDEGGRTAAVILSFVASCRLAGVDVYTWFRDVLTRIAEGHPVNRLAELLPHRWSSLPA
jgi:transposase